MPWMRAGPQLYIIAGSVTLNCPLKILNYTIVFSFRTVLVDREVVSFHLFFLKLFTEVLCKVQVTQIYNLFSTSECTNVL